MTAKTQAAAANTNTTATATVTPLVPKSKIDLAREHFHRINAEGYAPKAGSSPRKDFLEVCINELEMTENGASTYWQNLRNEDKGDPLYKGSRAPTGAPRGRRVDQAGRVNKAAAKVKRLQDRVNDDMKLLQDAQTELVAVTTEVAGMATAG